MLIPLPNSAFEDGATTNWTVAPQSITAWANDHVYALGAWVKATSGSPTIHFYAKNAGTSASTEPNWASAPNKGDEVVDNDITWVNNGNIMFDYAVVSDVFDPEAGSKSLKIYNGGHGWLYRGFDTVIGNRYIMTARFKIINGSGRTDLADTDSMILFTFASDTGAELVTTGSNTITKDWFTITLDHIALATAARIQIRINSNALGNDSVFYVTNFQVDDLGAVDVPVRGTAWGAPIRPYVMFHKEEGVFNLWFTSPDVDPWPEDDVPSGAVGENPKVELNACRGEMGRFQLVLKPEAEMANVTWGWTAIGDLPDTVMEVFKVETVALPIPLTTRPYQRCYDSGETTCLVPDPLPPFVSETLAAGSCYAFFFTIKVPESATPKIHAGTISLYEDGVLKATVAIELTVANILLSGHPLFEHNCALDSAHIDDFETLSDVLWARYINFFLDRRLNTSCSDPAYKILVGWDDFPIIVADCSLMEPIWSIYGARGWKAVGFTHTMQLSNPSAQVAITKDEGEYPPGSGKIFHIRWSAGEVSVYTDDTYTVFTEDFKTSYGMFHQQIMAAALALGCPGLYDKWGDDFQETPLKIGYLNIAKFVRDVDGRFFFYASSGSPAVPNIIWRTHNYVALSALGWEFKNKYPNIGNTGTFNNGWGRPEISPLRHRMFCWACYLANITEIDWNIVSGYSSTNNPWDHYPTGTSLQWLYPPRAAVEGEVGPISSTRLEGLSHGTTDYELFKYLERLIATRQHLASVEDLATAQAALDAVATAITHFPGGSVNHEHFHIFDLEAIELIRSNVIAAIELLQKYTTAHPQVGGVGYVNGISGVAGVNIGAISGVSD